MDWRRVIEEIAFSGRSGLTRSDLFTKLRTLFPDYKFDQVTEELVWKRICRQPEVEALDGDGKMVSEVTAAVRVKVNLPVWEHLVLEGRAIKLSELNTKCLEAIAAAGPDGILQPELGPKIRMDQRNLHYHLLSLHRHGVIVRVPVASKKAFTYLCILSRWVDEQEAVGQKQDGLHVTLTSSSGVDAHVRPPPPILMRRVTELLCSAPEQSLSYPELYRLLGLPPARFIIRSFRPLLRQLVERGFVDMILMRSLGGPRQPVYRYRKSFDPATDMEDLESSKMAEENADENGDGEDEDDQALSGTAYAPDFVPFVSIEKQARDLIAASGRQGLTLGDLKRSLGLTTKNAFKVHTRLVESERFILNSDVVRVTEFAGKERRHRLFLKGFEPGGNAADVQSKTPTLDSNLPSETPGTPTMSSQKAAGTPTGKSVRGESLTRIQRKQHLLRMLEEADPPIIEINRSLGVTLGQIMAQHSSFPSNKTATHIVDIKTLRKTISDIEADGTARQVIISGSSAAHDKILLVPASMAHDDPRLLRHISILKSQPRIYDLTKKRPAPDHAEEDGEDDDNDEEQENNEQARRKRLEFYGFVFGIMKRVRLLHEWLLSKIEPGAIFDTPTILFEQLPLGLFLACIGITTVSPALKRHLLDVSNRHLPLSQLPPTFHSELMRRRGCALRRGLRGIMVIMAELGLVVPAEDGISRKMRLKIPLAFRLSPILHCTVPPDAHSVRILTLPDDAPIFWEHLESNWKTDEPISPELSQAYHLAANKSSWLQLRPAIAKRVVGEKQLDEMAAEMGVAPALLGRMMQENPRMRPLRRRPISIHDQVEKSAEEKAESKVDSSRTNPRSLKKPTFLAEWTSEDIETIKLISVLLHHAPFAPVTQSPISIGHGLAWQIAVGLLPAHDNISMRTFNQRMFLSDWKSTQETIELERLVNALVAATGTVPELPEGINTAETLQVAFHAYYHTVRDLLATHPLAAGKPVNHPERPLRQIWKLNKSRTLADWNRVRHYRAPMMHQFEDTPNYMDDTMAFTDPLGDVSAEIMNALVTIRTIMTWPSQSYSATDASFLLARHDPEAIRSALQILLAQGFLSRASKGRHRYRVPGTNFALSHRVASALLRDNVKREDSVKGNLNAKFALSLDIESFFDGLLSKEVGLAEDIVHGDYTVQLDGSIKDPIYSLSNDFLHQLLVSLDLWLLPGRSWFWLNGDNATPPALSSCFHATLLRGALSTTLSLIKENPGLSCKSARDSTWPFLIPTELDDCLLILQRIGACTVTEDHFVYPNLPL